MRSKKLALIASTILCAICMIFGIVACGGGSAGDAIKAYIFPQAETLVSEDFSLPKRIGENNSVSVKWKSSNTNAIAIEDGGEQYTAKVTLQDEVTEVTLTISSGSASKDFIVRVGKLDVYTFMQRYSFPQRNTAVSEDFDLDTSVTVQGKTATIAWSVDPDYADFIALDGTKVVVTPGDELTAVKIKATFTYGEEEASMSYPFNVVPALSHRQSVNKMYSIDGYPLTLSGYIVNVLETSASYGNATLFMIDDDFCSGYYLYRIKIDKDNIDKYVEGAHITVSNDTAKNFNGLWENNGGGTATVDDQEPINPREKIYAFDTDLLSGVPSMIWHESTLVSLSGWKVKSVETAPDAVDDQTNTYMFTVERGDVSIPVRFSKYVGRTDAERADLLAMWKSIEVDTYVDITGLLGNYNGYQIQPVLASDITKVNAEGTNTDGAKVKAAVDAVNAKVKTNFSGLITSDQSFPMPTSEQGVTITYTVMGKKDGATVSYENGTLTVNPVATNKNTEVEVTYTIGDYTAYGFFTVRNYKASATELLADAKANVEAVGPLETKVAGNVTILPADVDLLGAEISWAIADAPFRATPSRSPSSPPRLPPSPSPRPSPWAPRPRRPRSPSTSRPSPPPPSRRSKPPLPAITSSRSIKAILKSGCIPREPSTKATSASPPRTMKKRLSIPSPPPAMVGRSSSRATANISNSTRAIGWSSSMPPRRLGSGIPRTRYSPSTSTTLPTTSAPITISTPSPQAR